MEDNSNISSDDGGKKLPIAGLLKIPPLAFWSVLLFYLFGFVFSALGTLRDFAMTVLLGLVLSLAMEPIVAKLNKKGIKRGVAAFGTLFLVFTVTIAAVAAIGALVVTQGLELAKDLPNIVEEAALWAESTVGAKINTSQITGPDGPLVGLEERMSEKISGEALSVSGKIGAEFAKLLALGFVAFYLSADGPKIRRSLCRLFRPDRQTHVLKLFELAIAKTGGYLLSRVILAALSMMVHAVGFTLIGVPYPLPMAIWMGVISQLIPVVGTYLAASAPIVLALADQPSIAIMTIIFIVVYQQIENLVAAPRIVGSTVQIHPLLGFVSVIVGAIFAGAAGALIAVPLVATAHAFISSIWRGNDIHADHEDHLLLAGSQESKPAD